MKTVDYIIVGCGLAGIAFAEILKGHQKSFIVFDDASQQSSVVAAGLYNPIVLKRFTPVWKSQEQLTLALPLYKSIEKRLQITLDYKFRVLRKFASIEEQNLWFEALDRPGLKEHMSDKLIKETYAHISSPFGFGEVMGAGRIDTETLITNYKTHLASNGELIEERFDYGRLQVEDSSPVYKNIKAKHIIFAEGFGVKQNPFFKSIPLNGTKGELLTIKAPKLQLNMALKASVFVIPLGNDLYKVGSTYNWNDKSNIPSEEGKNELVSKLKSLITCDFEIVDQSAGVRPTTKDRRPLVGSHDFYKNIYVLNGLGTRGVMIAPYVAKALFDTIEFQKPLEKEIDYLRFF